MNKQKGNMYPFVSHTWNPIKGKCPHECFYCYYQSNPRYKEKIGELRLDDKCFKDNLGSGNFIFVGSSIDMFADKIPFSWISGVLKYCQDFDNTYLFQTKNPHRFKEFTGLGIFPSKAILGVTIETTQNLSFGKATSNPCARYLHFKDLPQKKMVSIEPIVDFNVDTFVKWIKDIEPEFVSIGADSKNHKLPEPSKDKIKALIKKLRTFTEVKIKDNLRRLTG